MKKNGSGYSAGELIKAIENELDAGTYRVGGWQALLDMLKDQNQAVSTALSQDLTRVSDKLHRRNGFPETAAWMGFVGEYLVFAMSVGALTFEATLARLGGVILLAMCLQPLIKITVGWGVGVRYSYVYLWYFEPRFKMQFGSYQQMSRGRKLSLQLAGSVGTPVALLVGWIVLEGDPLLSLLCLLGALGALALQVGAFFAVSAGVNKVGPFLLTNLTTPAMLAKEWKQR
ncbi:hypothetical protein OAL10_11945 [Gammaproteobacteria bacterium]|nr:hypothetical protein [Gammaproteobacteria bacterium]